jgi:hypothetical protein
MTTITNFLLETDANPYAIFPDNGGYMGSAENFASLLHQIYHALVDDGDICFPVVNGEPRICFVWKHEDNIKKYVLSKTEQQMERNYGSEYEITFLDNVDDFISAFKAFQIADIKRCFLKDAESQGIEFAVKHYSHYKCFDQS